MFRAIVVIYNYYIRPNSTVRSYLIMRERNVSTFPSYLLPSFRGNPIHIIDYRLVDPVVEKGYTFVTHWEGE